MEANTRSPIFTGFSEMLEGIVTVRAFGSEIRLLNAMYDKVDLTTRVRRSLHVVLRPLADICAAWVQLLARESASLRYIPLTPT